MAHDAVDVIPFSTPGEYRQMIAYFHGGSDEFLRGMGIDRAKLMPPDEWLAWCIADAAKHDGARERCFVAWLYRGEQVGHSSLSHIKLGVEGHIHLHLWRPELRKDGLGAQFFTRSMDYFFERFALQKIICEPMATNPAPNRTVMKLGFTFVKRYRTVPVSTSFEQDVNRYEMTRDQRAAQRISS